MHFWIDKRSQCGYSGRPRVPTSLSAGVGRSRGRVGVGVGRKGMVTPVHRFQAVECVPRRPHRNTYRCYGPPPMPAVQSAHGARRQGALAENSVYVEVSEPTPTLQSLAAQRRVTPGMLLRTAALGLQEPPQHMPQCIKYGVWLSFMLAILFVAGEAMRGSAGGEAGVMCAVVGAIAACGCALTLCRSRPPPLTPPDRVSSTAHRPPMTPTREPSSDDISLGTLLQTVSSERTLAPSVAAVASPSAATEAPPPPYHIAVLLPGRESSPHPPTNLPDPPPPAYSAIT